MKYSKIRNSDQLYIDVIVGSQINMLIADPWWKFKVVSFYFSLQEVCKI